MAITRAQQAKQLLAQGGRIGFKGGADMGTVDSDTRKATAKSVSISPSGDVTTSTTKGPEGPDRSAVGRDSQYQKNRDLQRKLLNTPFKGPKTPIGAVNLLTGAVGQYAYNKNTKFFASNNIGGKINPRTGKPFGYGKQGYTDYMKQRLGGEVDAMGNPINSNDDDDDPFIPINQMSTNMNQESNEDVEVLSPIQQAILDRGDASAFLATGGRVGFKGGADMSTVEDSKGKVGAKSVNISPSGDVTTSRDRGPEGPDDRASDDQNMVQMLVQSGYTPEEIRRITGGPNVIDRIKESPLNNPLTRGILRTGLYTLNPTLGPLDFRRAMQLKWLYDTTMDSINYPDEEDMTLGLMTDQQKNIIDKQINMGKLTGAFDPDATFEAAKVFDDKGSEGVFGIGAREAEPMTREEFDAYVRENRAGGGPVGGIMDLESGRQMYFLGKLVKKATRAVKKIVKSPVGKAALLYFGGQALTSGGLGTFLKTKAAPFLFNEGKAFGKGNIGFLDMLKGGLSGGGKFALGSGLTLAPLLFQQEEEEPQFADSQGAKFPDTIPNIRDNYRKYMARAFVADGGIMRAGYEEGGDAEPVAKKTMPLLDMDGMEKDYRADGGFVPIGRMERADDVPARLSKNEFVFTADAVRNAGEGDIDKGADVMYNMMKNLEAGGEVSEESQGLEGAREMFKTSQRLEEVI